VRDIGPEDFLYAGARLTSGQLRAVVRWNGNDRHWMRLTYDPNRAARLHAPSVISARKWATHVAPLVVALTAFASWFQEPGWGGVLQYALATAGVLLSPAGLLLIQAEVMRVVLSALRHGIVITTASAIEAASKTSAAVFCARGTLLLGEPELSFLHPMGAMDAPRLLALTAGAEQVSSHPIANSVLRAARAQNIVPDAVRNPRSEPGLGVTALSSDGRTLIVGSRALMLRERISVARAEQQITELEATGRTVLLVALDGHLAGILAFQDGLRAGARASVQHLLDAGIEPILLSGDARETCEALAKTIDVEHVRPDVLPAERGKEIERLRGGGGVIAVVGRSPTDDLALSAASVGIALPGRGSHAGGFDIELASDEVQNAALALNLLTRHRKRVQRSQAIVFGGGLLLVFAALALAIPAGFLPVCALVLFGLAHALTVAAPNSSSLDTR
jgi:Cu+-exporting ATPase